MKFYRYLLIMYFKDYFGPTNKYTFKKYMQYIILKTFYEYYNNILEMF